MLRKLMMISLYVMIGYQAKAIHFTPMNDRAPASEVALQKATPKKTQNICMIQAGDIGKLKYKGHSYEDAFSKVTDECFQRRTQLFVKNRKMQPDQDRQIKFAESCVNSIKCI